jgi:hypothetical protein
VTEFRKYPSIPRYRKDIHITEKIDGTNATIVITDEATPTPGTVVHNALGKPQFVYAQSRTRFVSREQDNHGFASWVFDNAEELADLLGEGYHYGEWWGSGINRDYGLKNGEKHFSLFNPDRYDYLKRPNYANSLLTTVPVLYRGPAYMPYMPANSDTRDAVEYTMQLLRRTGSWALGAEGYYNPEGVVVYHTAARQLFKVTYEYDEGKWAAPKQ